MFNSIYRAIYRLFPMTLGELRGSADWETLNPEQMVERLITAALRKKRFVRDYVRAIMENLPPTFLSKEIIENGEIIGIAIQHVAQGEWLRFVHTEGTPLEIEFFNRVSKG